MSVYCFCFVQIIRKPILLHHFQTGWIHLKSWSVLQSDFTAFDPNLSQLDKFMIKHADNTQRQIKVFHIYSDTCCLYFDFFLFLWCHNLITSCQRSRGANWCKQYTGSGYTVTLWGNHQPTVFLFLQLQTASFQCERNKDNAKLTLRSVTSRVWCRHTLSIRDSNCYTPVVDTVLTSELPQRIPLQRDFYLTSSFLIIRLVDQLHMDVVKAQLPCGTFVQLSFAPC